jgi:hypothetical protein
MCCTCAEADDAKGRNCKGNLVKDVADAMGELDGVAVEGKIAQSQLPSGKFLILSDGVSEVETDKQPSPPKIFTQDADCRGRRLRIATPVRI